MRCPALLVLAAALLAGAVSGALAQGTVLQGGPTGPGRVPMYSSPRTSQPIILDSGTAAGGPAGVGLSELLLVARGVGTPPYASQGSGPFGTNACMYDAPITNAMGYHYLCFSANAQGGGLLAYGAGGAATQLPFSFNINGVAYQFPFSATGSCGGVFASGELCANAGASTAFPANVTLSALLNRVFGTTPNQLLYNNAGAWSALPSANNAVLVTNGTGVPSFSATLPVTAGRTILQADLTYYVRTDGSNVNCTGLTNAPYVSGGYPQNCAFVNIQYGLNAVGALILNNHNGTIQVGLGSYPEALTCPAMLTGNRITGGGTVKILGDTTTPSNVEIGGASFTGTPFSCNNIGYFVLDGVRLSSNASRLVDINAGGVTVQLNGVELNNLGPVQSGRIGFGANLFILGPVSIISAPSTPGQAIFTSQGAGSTISINNAAVSPRGALEFPTSLGLGLYAFYTNDEGFIQVESAATFVNAVNWQGKFAHVTIRGIMQVNPALSAMPGGATFDTDGTGIITNNNLTVASGVYFGNPVGALSWIGTNTFTNTIDASANTASRSYVLPDAATTLAGLSVAQTFTAAQTIQSNAFGALSVGPNGATNPSFRVDANTVSAATGLVVQAAAAGGGVNFVARSSGTDENFTINAKGAGTITLGNTSTGNIVFSRDAAPAGNIIFSAIGKTVTLKQGANGAVGTFICTSGGSITVTNSFVAVTDTIIISLNTAGGTISNAPALNAITASTSFVAKCATSDTSTYNYAIIKNAA